MGGQQSVWLPSMFRKNASKSFFGCFFFFFYAPPKFLMFLALAATMFFSLFFPGSCPFQFLAVSLLFLSLSVYTCPVPSCLTPSPSLCAAVLRLSLRLSLLPPPPSYLPPAAEPCLYLAYLSWLAYKQSLAAGGLGLGQLSSLIIALRRDLGCHAASLSENPETNSKLSLIFAVQCNACCLDDISLCVLLNHRLILIS